MSLLKYSRRNFLLGTAATLAAPGVIGLIAGDRGVELEGIRKNSL